MINPWQLVLVFSSNTLSGFLMSIELDVLTTSAAYYPIKLFLGILVIAKRPKPVPKLDESPLILN